MKFLVLTKAEADAVRGETTPYHALVPIEQEDGTFILPDAVLTDQAHKKKLSSLDKLLTKLTATNKVSVEEAPK